MLACLNIAFFVFHTALIAFNVAGWAWSRTRIWNLITLTLTALSWFVMGLWHGIGYCICTDWHMQVRQAMGIRDPESSYVQFLFSHVLRLEVPTEWVNALCGVIFGIAVLMSVSLNSRDWTRVRKAKWNQTP